MLNTCCNKKFKISDSYVSHRSRKHGENFATANSQRIIQNEANVRDLMGPFSVKYVTTFDINDKKRTTIVYDNLANFNTAIDEEEIDDDEYEEYEEAHNVL